MSFFATFKDEYEQLWDSLTIRPEKLSEVERAAEHLLKGKATYQQIEASTGVPWWFIGLCHYRESGFDFETYLGNGQSLNQVTTIVPKGRGPFGGPNAFLNGAIDALRLEGFLGATDWSIARVLYRLEGFNGYGYHRKQVASPYLWGGSTAYGPPNARGGKFIRDHVFDATVVDTQLGTAVIFKALCTLDQTITLADAPAILQSHAPDEELEHDTLWVQQSLNRLGAIPRLSEDGKLGPKTMNAISAFQEHESLEDTGLADARTVAAIQKALIPVAPALNNQLTTRLEALERQLTTVTTPANVVVDKTIPAVPRVTDINSTLNALLAPLQQILDGLAQQQTTTGSTLETFLKAIVPLKSAIASPQGIDTLGQVNGALGSTIGQLLNGKKTAIGIIGAMATQILSQVPATTGLGQVLSLITPAAGLSPYTMPIFLALAAWGALGKFEKWNAAALQKP